MKAWKRWYPGPASGNESRLYGLEPGVTYEYRIGSRCVANDVLNYSVLKSFTMPDKPERNPECGLLPEVNLSNRTPAEELLPGMLIFVGDFPVFISTVTGSSGRFSGTGYVGIPFLGLPKVAVLFNNIFVNNDLHLVEGFIEVKYDENGKTMMTGDGTSGQGGGGGIDDNRTDDEKAKYMTNYTLNPNAPVEIKETTVDNLSDEIKTAMGYNTADGQNGSATVYVITVEDSEGNKHNVVVDAITATITDKDGNTYVVDENGNLSVIEELGDAEEGDTAKALECGCPQDIFQGILNGDCDRIFKLLQTIKIAYGNKKQLTLNKYALLNERISIDSRCISDLYFDMSWVKGDTVAFNPATYKVTKSSANAQFGGGTKYWTIKYEEILEIKIMIIRMMSYPLKYGAFVGNNFIKKSSLISCIIR